MRIRVENDSQRRIALAVLHTLTGLPYYDAETLEEHVQKYAKLYSAQVTVSRGEAVTCAGILWDDGRAYSFAEFMKIVPELSAQPRPIKIDEHVVEFRENGIQVGCTFVPHGTINAIVERIREGKK